MILKKQREIFLIYGKTGSGKTTLAKDIIKNYKRIIIIDNLAEYDGTIIENFSDFCDYIIDKKEFVICCRFTEDEDYEYLFKVLFEIPDILLVLEEAEMYISPYAKRTDFLRLVKYGRHRDISILGIARRTSELSSNFRSQVDKIYTFKQTEPNDLKILEDLGFNINEVQNLPEYKFSVISH